MVHVHILARYPVSVAVDRLSAVARDGTALSTCLAIVVDRIVQLERRAVCRFATTMDATHRVPAVVLAVAPLALCYALLDTRDLLDLTQEPVQCRLRHGVYILVGIAQESEEAAEETREVGDELEIGYGV